MATKAEVTKKIDSYNRVIEALDANNVDYELKNPAKKMGIHSYIRTKAFGIMPTTGTLQLFVGNIAPRWPYPNFEERDQGRYIYQDVDKVIKYIHASTKAIHAGRDKKGNYINHIKI